jgi:hypothetical protein
MKKQLLSIVWVSLIFTLGTSGFAQPDTPDIPGNGKNVGIAINPVLALFEWGSGEINLWSIDRSAEINIPIQYMNNPFFLDDDDSDVQYYSIGIYYRRFFSEQQKGFFLQAGWKYDHAKASDNFTTETGSIHSLLFGFGYRVIAKNGIFWGCGLSAGRAWGTMKDTNGETIRGTGLTFDIDLFKFGFAW